MIDVELQPATRISKAKKIFFIKKLFGYWTLEGLKCSWKNPLKVGKSTKNSSRLIGPDALHILDPF
jgi:hypothetical protein